MRERSARRRWFDSALMTVGGMAVFTASFAIWSAFFPVSYSADEVRMHGIAYLMGSAGAFMLIHSINEPVQTHREMRAEARERPERERKIEEARQAAEAEAAAHRGDRDV
jgi:hypothetical protein